MSGAGENSSAVPTNQGQVTAVSVKPPEFLDANASGWFEIMKAQFVLAQITQSSTKFYHILAALPASIAQRLPPHVLASQDFEQLQEAVIAQVERSRPELFQDLTATCTLVGKPSVFLSELQKTAEKVGVGEEFTRHRFLQALPATISPVLAAQPTLTLGQIGGLADELMSLATLSEAPCNSVQTLESRPSQSFRFKSGLPSGCSSFSSITKK